METISMWTNSSNGHLLLTRSKINNVFIQQMSRQSPIAIFLAFLLTPKEWIRIEKVPFVKLRLPVSEEPREIVLSPFLSPTNYDYCHSLFKKSGDTQNVQYEQIIDRSEWKAKRSWKIMNILTSKRFLKFPSISGKDKEYS